MTAETAYQFLKPSLERLTDRQREKLCELINGKPNEKKEFDPIHSVEFYKKRLLKTVFKSRIIKQ